MCNECSISGDNTYIEKVLPYYLSILHKSPNKTIKAHEVDSVIARALHHHAEDELMWLGGEQKVSDFIQRLETLRGHHH